MPQEDNTKLYPAIDKRVPLQKRCSACHTKKLLNEFQQIGDASLNKRKNICKFCEQEICDCDSCLSDAMSSNFESTTDLMLILVKGGMELSQDLIEKLKYIIDLSNDFKH